MYEPKPKRNKLKKITAKDRSDRWDNELRRYVYWMWFYDIDFFSKYHLSHWMTDWDTWKQIKSPKVHSEMLKLFKKKWSTLILFPRWFAKTTNIKKSTMHDVCYWLEEWILFIMPKQLWEKTIWDIREEFETNETIKDIFFPNGGSFVPNRTKDEQRNKWRWNYLMFLNWVDLQSITKKQAIRGARKTKIHIDDPEEDSDVKNIEITQQFKSWVAWTIIPIIRKWKLIVTWTVISENCFVWSLYKNANRYKKMKYEACEDPEFEEIDWRLNLVSWKPLRKEMRPIKTLNEKLLDMQDNDPMFWAKIFMREYFHKTFLSMVRSVFDEENIKNKVVPEPIEKSEEFPWLWMYKSPCECSWWIDLSMWWPNWDFTTIVARDFEYKLVFVFQARILRYGLIDIIDYLDERWYFWIKVFERNVGTAQAIFDMVQDRTRYNDIYRQKNSWQVVEKETLNLWRHTNKQSKDKMISRMQSVYFGYEDDWGLKHYVDEIDSREKRELFKYYIDEKNRMNALPPNHDDLIIADALCLQWVKEWLWYDLDF